MTEDSLLARMEQGKRTRSSYSVLMVIGIALGELPTATRRVFMAGVVSVGDAVASIFCIDITRGLCLMAIVQFH